MNPDKGWDYNPGKDLLIGVNRAIADRQGKTSPVLLSALNSKIADDMKIITVPGFHLVQHALANVADKIPEWFPKGINGIYAVSNPELFAGFNPETGAFYISTSDELVKDFKPAHELISALQKIQTGELLTFNNEYAVETLWHEIMHGITGINAARIQIGKEPFEEGLIQAISRLSYPRLLEKFGYKATHQNNIITNGHAYPRTARNIVALIDAAKIDNQDVLDLFLQRNTEWKGLLSEMLSVGLNIKKDRISTLYGHATGKPLKDFMSKIAVLTTNAPRNNQQ